MSVERPKRKVYMVLASVWAYNDEWHDGDDTPVKAFSDRAKAEAHRDYLRALDRAHPERMFGLQGEVQYNILETEVEV